MLRLIADGNTLTATVSYVLLVLLLVNPIISTNTAGIHLPLYRRGGQFSLHEFANLTTISQTLTRIEARYARSYTDVDGNRIIRRWRHGPHGSDEYLLDGAGIEGSWYTILQVGTPPQALEVDIDMLSPDFYTIMTTSGKGSKYDTFASSSHEPSQEHIHPICLSSTDTFHLPTLQSPSSPLDRLTKPSTTSLRLPLPICQPPKYSHNTLHRSGSILGLSPSTQNIDNKPSSPLSRLSSPSLLHTLLSQTTISEPLIHITLLTDTTGILTLGTPPVHTLELTKITLEKQLSHLSSRSTSASASAASDPDTETLEQAIAGAMNFAVPSGSTTEDHFKWSDLGNGAVRGWHMGLISGIWVDGVKVVRNQMVLFDVNCPVILAPWGVGDGVYGGVGGARRVESLIDEGGADANMDANLYGGRASGERGFWAVPCLTGMNVEFEIAGWRFPVGGWNGNGLGKVDVDGDGEGREEKSGTGYCTGVIVETDMGVRREWARSAMKDVWVLGEPFFRGLGVVFDFGDGKRKGGRVGLRKY